MLVAIEGIDGAGKGTVASAISKLMAEKGRTTTILRFPQYDTTYGGRALGDFLSNRFPKPLNVHVVAALYALDRFEVANEIHDLIRNGTVVICDRYIASNLAFQAAKAPLGKREQIIQWILDLETMTYGLPIPAVNLLLNTSVKKARQNVQRKENRSYTDLEFDIHEEDETLQTEALAMYEKLAKSFIIGRWITVNTIDQNHRMIPARQIAKNVIKELEFQEIF